MWGFAGVASRVGRVRRMARAAGLAGVGAVSVTPLVLAVGCSGTARVDEATRPLTVSTSADAGGAATAAPSASAASADMPTPSTSTTTGSAPAPTSASTTQARTSLADGRHPARVAEVDAAARLVTVDVVQFFLGEDAAAAAAEDGAAEVPPANDHYVRNVSPALRTLPVAADALVTTNAHTPLGLGRGATTDHPVSLEQLASFPAVDDAIFWVEVEVGTVIRLAEQYLP